MKRPFDDGRWTAGVWFRNRMCAWMTAAVAGVLCPWISAAGAEADCAFTCFVDFETGTTNRGKPGIPGFLSRHDGPEAGGPRYYLSNVVETIEYLRVGGNGYSYNSTLNRTVTTHYPTEDPYTQVERGAKCPTPAPVMQESAVVHHEGSDISGCHECQATSSQEVWSPDVNCPTCHKVFVGVHVPGWNVATNIQTDEAFLVEERTYQFEGGTGDAYRDHDYFFRRVTRLSDEYTTDDLIDDLIKAATNHVWTGTWTASGHASLSLAAQRDCARATALRYRFRLIGPRGETATLRWIERFTREEDGAVIDSERSRLVRFTGDVQELIGLLPPPATPGTTQVILPPAPSCSRCEGGQAGIDLVHGPEIVIGLGPATRDVSAGFLRVAAADEPDAMVDPDALGLFAPTGLVTEHTNSAGMRQVRAPTLLADIRRLDAASCQVRLFDPVDGPPSPDGLWPVSGEPFAWWTLSRSTLRPAEVDITGANGWTGTFRREADGWTLLRADRESTAELICHVSEDGRFQTNILRRWGVQGAMASEVCTVFQVADGGDAPWILRQGTIDASAEERWAYWDELPEEDPRRGLPRLHVAEDGSWERYEYDPESGRMNKLVAGFLNAPPDAPESQCRMWTFGHAPFHPEDSGMLSPETPRIITEHMLGAPVAREFHVVTPLDTFHIRAVMPAASWDAPGNRVTQTRRRATSDGLGVWTWRPDGTMSVMGYATNALSGERVEVREEGLPDDPALDRPAVVEGERTERRFDRQGRLVMKMRSDIATGAVLEHITFTHDARGRLQRQEDLVRDRVRDIVHDCCRIQWERDEDGSESSYQYDALGRMVARVRGGITWSNVYDAADRLRSTWRLGSDGTGWPLVQRSYDMAGRLLEETDATGHLTRYQHGVETDGSSWTEIRFADGTWQRDTRYRDGQMAEHSGNAAHPVRYHYGIAWEGLVAKRVETRHLLNGPPGKEWIRTWHDPLDRPFRVEQPSPIQGRFATHETFFDGRGHPWRTVDPDGVVSLRESTALERVVTAGIDHDRNDRLDWSGQDMMTQRETGLVQDFGQWAWEERTWVWPTNGQDTALPARSERRSVDGRFLVQVEGGRTNRMGFSLLKDGRQYRTNQTWQGLTRIVSLEGGRPVLEAWVQMPNTLIARTNHTYDAHGRLARLDDVLGGGAISFEYDRRDQLIAEVVAEPGEPLRTTRFSYDERGRLTSILHPDGTDVQQAWTANGQIKAQWGTAVRHVEYDYDFQGRRVAQRTWRTGQSHETPALTTWTYDAALGHMAAKVYPDGGQVLYQYTPAGRLESFRNARGQEVYYTHDASGRRTEEDSPVMGWRRTWTHDRMGRVIQARDGGTELTRAYNEHGSVLAEVTRHPELGEWSVLHGYDQQQQRVVRHMTGGAGLSAARDDSGRPIQIQTGSLRLDMAYLAARSMPTNIACSWSGVETLHIQQRLKANRVLAVQWMAPGQSAAIVEYTYDVAGRRVGESDSELGQRLLEYNGQGELIRSVHYTPDLHQLPGHEFRYDYDALGNRVTQVWGGDPWGGHQVPVHYAANVLNQYEEVRTPDWMLLSGRALPAARVTINQREAQRAGGHFWARLATGRSPLPRFVGVTNMAVLPGVPDRAAHLTGRVFVPPSPTWLEYDRDGNLVQDARWIYEWDVLGRLSALQTRSDLPQSAWRRLTFLYDPLDRRIGKLVSTWTGQGWSAPQTTWLMRDGDAIGATWDAVTQERMEFLWLDPPAGETARRGARQLLAVRLQRQGADVAAWWCVPDAAGTPRRVVEAQTGKDSEPLDLGPFGEPLGGFSGAATGLPIGFAGGYVDTETGLVEFGRRFYHPWLGRWISRDPLEESGGLNLYAYAENDPINGLDPSGLEPITDVTLKRKRIQWLAILKRHLGKTVEANDLYGHWWVEFEEESYGWWPASGVTLLTTFTGVPGQLNGTLSMHLFGLASSTRDGHHGDPADREFHPRRRRGFLGRGELEHGDGEGHSCRCASTEEIQDCLRGFAAQYSGNWSYPWGQNCHSFQRGALRECCLKP